MPAKTKKGVARPRLQTVPPEKPPQPSTCTVVGVGASAGGLEAFTALLNALPRRIGFALVFVQHQDPKHSSLLAELLQRATALRVVTITDGTPLEPDHVYVLPPNHEATVTAGLLRLHERRPVGENMPIDNLFRSLAHEFGSRAIGVVLSGTASDGTLGLKAIKAEGGITLAQDLHSAKFDGMPRSAYAAGCVDFMLPIESLAGELMRLCDHPYVQGTDDGSESQPDEQALADVFTMLRGATGVDFNYYKPGTIRRRIRRRMALHKLERVADYAAFLREHRGELQLLFQDMLINVTGFFREPATYEAIRQRILPALMKDRPSDEPIRVWVPGCATGEEVYSIAIVLLEHMRASGTEIPLQIFGTDLSDSALERARAGLYPDSIASEVSPERLRRFFVRSNNSFLISRTIRDVCVFARQNVTRDPPFSKLDLIVCRNLLIYLGPAIQMTVMKLFHYALRPTGFLVLGLSESVGPAAELFVGIDRKLKIYARKAAPANVLAEFGTYEGSYHASPVKHPVPRSEQADGQRRVDQLLLARHAPPAIVVDKDLDLLQVRGPIGTILQIAPGIAKPNLMRIAPASLGQKIKRLVERAHARRTSVKLGSVAITGKNRVQEIALSVTPLFTNEQDPQFLVVFEPVIPTIPAPKLPAAKGAKGDPVARKMRELEQELASTREYLQAVIEEQEASNEELKSAHEEVQSGNEELQSTNEELLTAKEELQSTNEELTTVNEEMQTRNSELQLLNNDLLNLLSSVNIPIVMLGNDLRIRRFTPQAERILNLLASDVGRPISDFRLKINLPDLAALCQFVVDDLAPVEREVSDAEGRIYSIWIRPYRTTENRIDGVVLAMLDITDRKVSAEARYRRLFEAAADGILIADATTGEIIDVNPSLTRTLGIARSQLVGTKLSTHPAFRGANIGAALAETAPQVEAGQLRVSLRDSAGDALDVDLLWNRFIEGDQRAVQLTIHDIDSRHELEQRVRREEEGLRQGYQLDAVGRLAGGVAHDFNNLLTAILGYCSLLVEDIHALPGEARALVTEIRAAAERASMLTKQLLAFGRKGSLQPEDLEVNQVVRELEQLMRVSLPRNVRLDLAPSADDAWVNIDRTQLEQIVLNLVLNARDAMPEGGTLSVTTAAVEVDDAFSRRHPAVAPGHYVRLEVRDSGTGMDAATQSRMFEPFFTTKSRGSGTGLGLATVYRNTRQSGGQIVAVSELGVGTTFALYFPRVMGPSASAGTRTIGDDRSMPVSETILLVEDDATLRSLAKRFLEARGYRVLEAFDGPEALRVSRQHADTIHMLLTDVVMPNMSGREVAYQLAAERPGMKVLYMSGHTEETIVHHGVLGEDATFLGKPFSRDALLDKVRRALDA